MEPCALFLLMVVVDEAIKRSRGTSRSGDDFWRKDVSKNQAGNELDRRPRGRRQPFVLHRGEGPRPHRLNDLDPPFGFADKVALGNSAANAVPRGQ